MAQCVFCDSSLELNTQISIKLDNGNKVLCDICDTHAEDATSKTVKAAYLEKQNKVESLLAQLKAMGVDVNAMEKSKGGLLIPPPQVEKSKPVQRTGPPEVIPEEDLKGENVVSTDLLDAKSRKGMASVGGAANFGSNSVSVSGHASFDPTIAAGNLPADQRTGFLQARKGKAKLTVVEGREGQPLVIAETRVDGMGTTRLKIVKKEDDNKMQGRFKRMANDSIHHDKTPNFAREGYQNTQTDCPICRGNCVIVQNNRETSCPKCNGAGVISVY